MTDPDNLVLPTTCPFCGKLNNRHHCAGEPKAPEAGDVGICWGCRAWFVFDSPTTIRRPTPDEQAEIDADPRVQLAAGVARESYLPTEAVKLTREILAEDEHPGA